MVRRFFYFITVVFVNSLLAGISILESEQATPLSPILEDRAVYAFAVLERFRIPLSARTFPRDIREYTVPRAEEWAIRLLKWRHT